MKKIFRASFLFPAILTQILILICYINYVPGTYLTGWDNLMPELNIWLNLKRSILAVWQEYQGLGLVGGMGHATDLVRQLIILPFTLILPISFIRYLWHFAMLFVGTFGIYFLTYYGLRFTVYVSFSSSLFYLLNFGTIQYFWAPLETFSTFWGFFPWLIFSLWEYLESVRACHDMSLPTKKLIIINLLAIPSFYVQTLFVVYLLCVGLVLLSHFILHSPNSVLRFTYYAKIILLIFAINSFWLLPQIYFLKENLNSPVAGIGNFMSSEESFARNQYRGYLADFLLLRNYYYDFPDKQGYFMSPWVTYFSNYFILVCGYLLSTIPLLGFIYLLSQPKKINLPKLSILFIFVLTATALLSATPPFSGLNSILRSSALLNQIFRAPFTKFIVPTIFTFSLLLAYGFSCIGQFLTQLKYSKNVQFILHLAFILLLFTFSFPVFQGHLFSSKMRQNIPQEYFDMFAYLREQSPSARIANLPSGAFWGWTNYIWGYRGSGFIWYSLPQPILDRAFDTWNLTNEQYYWELDQALQKKDPALLSQIIKKYSIEYILFDNNIYFPDEFIYSKLSAATPDILHNTPNISLERQFGKISLYRTSIITSPYILSNPVSTSTTKFFLEDSIFAQHQDYQSSSSLQNLDYPFLNLFSNRLQSEIPYNFKINDNNLTITRKSNSTSTTIPLDDSANLGKNKSQDKTTLSNYHSSQLLAYNFPAASLSKSYLFKVDYQYLTGLPLTLSINSDNRENKYLYTRLDKKTGKQTAWFIIPAREIADFNQGITVVFNNTSLNNSLSQNKIFNVNIYPIPLFDLIQQSSPTTNQISSRTNLTFTNHLFYYQTNVTQTLISNSYLVLPQSYSSGWLAFYFNGLRPVFLKDHSLINNWANGWQLKNINNKIIYIFFWPQFLEFLGLGMLIGAIIWIIKYKK